MVVGAGVALCWAVKSAGSASSAAANADLLFKWILLLRPCQRDVHLIVFETQGVRRRLGNGRRAGRNAAEDYWRNCNGYASQFHAVNGRDNGNVWRGSRNGAACRGTDRAEMGIYGSGVQLQTAMQLRREEDDPEEQSQEIDSLGLAVH